MSELAHEYVIHGPESADFQFRLAGFGHVLVEAGSSKKVLCSAAAASHAWANLDAQNRALRDEALEAGETPPAPGYIEALEDGVPSYGLDMDESHVPGPAIDVGETVYADMSKSDVWDEVKDRGLDEEHGLRWQSALEEMVGVLVRDDEQGEEE